MKEAGYTLVEMLAALAMLGLAFSGLVEGARVIGQMQKGAVQAAHSTAADRSAELALSRLAEGAGPFFSDGRGAFTGTPTALDFDCAGGARCGAALRLSPSGAWLMIRQGASTRRLPLAAAQPQFSYIDAEGAAGWWPPAQGRTKVLKAILLKDAGATAAQDIATARLWVEEPSECVFDAIAQDCRR